MASLKSKPTPPSSGFLVSPGIPLTSSAIEIEFGLVKAQSSKQTNKLKIDSVNFPRIFMANRKQKRAIANVLMKVIPQYKFVSLSVLNAVLKLYNITADRGERDSRIYKVMDSLIGYWMRRKIKQGFLSKQVQFI